MRNLNKKNQPLKKKRAKAKLSGLTRKKKGSGY